LLSSFSLCSTVQSPTRIHNNSTSAIGNTFIDKVSNDKYATCLYINGLFDQNAKIVTIQILSHKIKLVILKLEENLINL